MLTSILSLGAGGLYMGAGAVLARHVWGSPLGSLRLVFALVSVAIVAHGVLLWQSVFSYDSMLVLGLTNAASLTAWIIAVIFVVTALVKPAYEVGSIILPISAVAVVAAWIWPPAIRGTVETTDLTIHLLVSLAAYGFLALAVGQAIIMSLQDHRLKVRSEASVLRKLPPLETMEELLFQLVGIGFVLLTLGLITGFWFSAERLGAAFVFNHHTVLALIAWLIFGTLLLGHLRFGWRGRTATRWTIGGFVVLALAYFGWVFVLEILLNRR